MKMGMRKPSIKKSVKARTTGAMKRKVKSSIDPTYGKSGMGYVKNPKKAAKDAVYHKTTVGVGDLIDSLVTDDDDFDYGEDFQNIAPTRAPKAPRPATKKSLKAGIVAYYICIVVFALSLIVSLGIKHVLMILISIGGLCACIAGISKNKKQLKEMVENGQQ